MATGKVILEQGFTRKGKAYAKGDEFTGNKAELDQLERLGYVKLSGEKATEKTKEKRTASKGKGAAKKQSTVEPTAEGDVTE